MSSSTQPLRVLQKHWKLTFIAVFSLSIAMALGVIVLGVSNTFLLLPPAGVAPERLVMIHSRTLEKAIDQVSYPDYQYYRQNNHVFTDVAAAPDSVGVTVTRVGTRAVSVVSRPVSDNYFKVLGIQPYIGRLLEPGDDIYRCA